MKEVHYEPEEIWPLYLRSGKEVADGYLLIAENEDFGIQIFLTEEGSMPVIAVFADDDEVYEEATVSQNDCTQTVKKIYDDFLDPQRVVQKLIDLGADETADSVSKDDEDLILDREEELREAMSDFFSVVLDGCRVTDKTIVNDCIDHFLEYIARKWGIEDIRRPMFLEDENGDEFFEEYPYEVMEYEDEDNPIYK